MYNKLFTKILDSSVWLEADATRLVWITFLAAMDEDGFVPFSAAGNVSVRARVSLEAAEEAIAILEAPDSKNPAQEHEGRRIERVPYGWMVLNADKYRLLVKREISREQTRMRVAKFRSARNAPVTQANEKVTPSVSVSDTDKKKSNVGLKPDAINVLNFLNEKTGRHFRPEAANLQRIEARLKGGATVEDCRAVIAMKCREWSKDAKMAKYLRPATLFNAEKFAQYIGEIPPEPARKA